MEKNEKLLLDEFYQKAAALTGKDINALLPPDINKDVGHFNVFSVSEVVEMMRRRHSMPYNTRSFYKIRLINGPNRAEYADRVIEIEKYGLLFATPKVPYNWVPKDANQDGYFCVFTEDFLVKDKSGVVLDDLPLFRSGGYPVFRITEEEAAEVASLFRKMLREISSDYAFKYDLLRNYVLELIHYGQKFQPATALYPAHNASARVASLFAELLERQFPIESPDQRLVLRTAGDYAERLAIHVNHLNKVLKEQTGRTTTGMITSRVVQEAKILLRHTDWNVSEIAYCLGFREVAHFSNFFKKQTSVTPLAFRS